MAKKWQPRKLTLKTREETVSSHPFTALIDCGGTERPNCQWVIDSFTRKPKACKNKAKYAVLEGDNVTRLCSVHWYMKHEDEAYYKYPYPIRPAVGRWLKNLQLGV